MPIATGTRLGSYEITALLGAGGMGEVYRARDARLGRDVALKVLAPRLSGNRDAVARFEQEARSASALSHPHILHIYDIGDASVEGEPTRYMTMELVDGTTLSAKLNDAELADLLGWLAQVADGLAKAHEAGIVHRDLKPDNVMITRDGYAKILDFGLAKLVERPIDTEAATMIGAAPKSVPGMIMGTVAYMAPEQAQGKATDARADIFAFGCMLYEAAARRRAFGGVSVIDTLHQIVHSDPDFGALDPQIARIVRKCMAKDPAARYGSIRDVAKELRAIVNPQPAKATTKDERVNTIAVLPFDDLSPTRDNDYFAEGLAEEITSDLSKVRALRVISRASARKYRGEEKDIAKVAAELGAAFVIDGSVRKAGNQLRVTAQLIDTATQTQLWSDKYSGTLDDVFDIQENVARAVVERLKIELTSSEDAMLAGRSMSNVEAYECYLRARRYIWRFDAEGLGAALKEIERGISISGRNAALLGAQGQVYWQYYNTGIDPDPAHLDRAEQIAQAILESDPRSLHGLRLTALVAMQKQQIRRAVEYLEKTLEVDPNDLDALLFSIFVYALIGRDATSLVERLVAIDPLAAFTWAMPAVVPLFEGRFDETLRLMQRACALEYIPIFDIVLVQVLLLAGRTAEALQAVQNIRQETVFASMARALAFAAAGQSDAARAALTAETLEAARGDLQYSEMIAEVYALLGETDLALDWLDNAITRGFIPWPFLAKHDRLLDSLRGDPRFDALLERTRIEWQSFH